MRYEAEGAPEIIFDNIRVSRADRRRCPVCGHPTGDCKGSSGSPNHVLGVEFVKPVKDSERVVLVPEDIFEEVPLTPHQKTRVLVARAGSYVTREKAARYGLISE